MAKEMCRNHPDMPASGECKQCAVPFCEKCKTVRPQGLFCSELCAEKFLAFQDRALAIDAARERRLWRTGFKRILILGAVVLAAVLFLHLAYDVNSPFDLPAAFKAIWRDLSALF